MNRSDHPALLASASEVLALVGDAVVSTDESGRILLFNRAAEDIFGYPAGEVLGQQVEVLIPERFRHDHEAEVRKFAAGGEAANRIMGHSREVIGLRSNGQKFPVEATVSRRSVAGRTTLTAVIRDISERKRLQQELEMRAGALEESENRLRLALKGGHMGAWEWDLATDSLRVDRSARQLWGLPEGTELTAEIAFRQVYAEDLPGLREAIRQATGNGAEYDHEFRIMRPDGTMLWVSSKATVLRGPNGEPEKMIGLTSDVTHRRELEEQRRLLSAELNHRMKNVMALVNAVISMTARTAGSVESYRKSLQGRLGAIAKAHTVLLESGSSSVPLVEQLLSELEPYRDPEGTNIVLDGPAISLPPQMALSLRLVIHELATNAAKYGALSVPTGQIEVRWSAEEFEAGRRLLLDWRESGGPPVSPPSREGFGTTLITKSLTRSRGADVKLDYRPDGLRCRLRVPLRGVANAA